MRRLLLILSLSLSASLILAATADALTGTGTWNHVGTNGASPPGPALNGHVNEMLAVGTVLYVGGDFTNVGGPAGDKIAKWNGTSWSSIGSAPLADNGHVRAIATYGGRVYAGGTFLNAGGNPNADYLAVYDGVSWKPFCNVSGAAFNLQVNALQVVGADLFVGGTFQNANNVADGDYLVRCNMNTGAMSTTRVGGLTGPVYAMALTSDGKLYVGGNFGNLGSPTSNAVRVAWYDGTWHGLGTTAIGGIVRSLHAIGTDVYVASDGVNIGGNAKADHLVKWNGTSYSSVGSDSTGVNGYFPTSAYIYDLTSIGSLLFASGSWQNANGQPSGDMLAYFDGGTWRPLGSDGAGGGAMSSETDALAVFGGQLYAGGAISNGGGDVLADWIASRSLRLPDAAIRAAAGATIGNNVFNETAAGQQTSTSITRGTSKTFYVTIWNRGILPTTFKLKGAGASPGYTIRYYDDYQPSKPDITSAVMNGTFVTPQLAVTTGYPMTVVVTLSATAAASGSFTVLASSTAGTPKDKVKGIISAT